MSIWSAYIQKHASHDKACYILYRSLIPRDDSVYVCVTSRYQFGNFTSHNVTSYKK